MKKKLPRNWFKIANVESLSANMFSVTFARQKQSCEKYTVHNEDIGLIASVSSNLPPRRIGRYQTSLMKTCGVVPLSSLTAFPDKPCPSSAGVGVVAVVGGITSGVAVSSISSAMFFFLFSFFYNLYLIGLQAMEKYLVNRTRTVFPVTFTD